MNNHEDAGFAPRRRNEANTVGGQSVTSQAATSLATLKRQVHLLERDVTLITSAYQRVVEENKRLRQRLAELNG